MKELPKIFAEAKKADIEREVGAERMVLVASTLNPRAVSRVELEIRGREILMRVYSRYGSLTLYKAEPAFGTEKVYKEISEAVKKSTGFASLLEDLFE